MAKDDMEVKSGPGMAGSVAIATAIIGAVTTISVAYINKGGSTEKPPVEIDVADDTIAPAQPDAAEPAPEPQRFATPAIANVAGLWRAQDGEELEIGQAGSRLTFSSATMSAGVPISGQGVGKIDDRNIVWAMQLNANGNQVEADCKGRLTTSGRSLQGTCEMLGEKVAFIYSR